jgi:hypothetical protein
MGVTVTKYLIEVLGVMFDRSLDVVSDVRGNDISKAFGGNVRIFLFDDVI